jgi:opacity protein-like surface antigen
MTKRSLSICLGLLALATAISAEDADMEENIDFKISGSPLFTVFADHRSGLGRYNERSGFELKRAYMGYRFRLSPVLSGMVVADAANPSPDGSSGSIVLKHAQLTWEDRGFTVNAGMTGLLQFGLQEKAWGYRYIEDSWQSIKGMGPSADLGITVQYRFLPCLSADLSLTNGEGYKKIGNDGNYRYAAGLTLTPFSRFTFRAYADLYGRSDTANQRTLALFAHYKCPAFSLGMEYNRQAGHRFTKGRDLYGCSVYASVFLCDRWNIFGRYDRADSRDASGAAWYAGARDLAIAGVEYRPVKQLRIAPNYRYTYAPSTATVHELYLNVGFYW